MSQGRYFQVGAPLRSTYANLKIMRSGSCTYHTRQPDVIFIQVAGGVVSELELENAGHWLDHGTEHPHRIALSLQADKVTWAVERLGEGFVSEGLQARLFKAASELLSTFGSPRHHIHMPGF